MKVDEWELPAQARKPGFECLAFHRGKWVHVKWSASHNAWHLGYALEFINDGNRAFAHLPKNTPDRNDGNGFYDWKN